MLSEGVTNGEGVPETDLANKRIGMKAPFPQTYQLCHDGGLGGEVGWRHLARKSCIQ